MALSSGMNLGPSTTSLPAATATSDEAVEAAAIRIVAGHTAIFTVPPGRIPTTSTPDAPLLGNGDVGVAIGGDAGSQHFYIGKNDFWRMCAVQPHIITVGGVELNVPALAGASYRQEQDLLNAEVRGTFSKAGTTLRTRSFTAANENLLVTELKLEGGQPMPVTAAIWVGEKWAPAVDGKPADGEAVAWATRTAVTEAAENRRRVALAQRILGAPALTENGRLAFVLQPGGTAMVATAIRSDLDAQDPLAAARQRADELTLDALPDIITRHRQWWRRFWSLSFIEIPDKVIEQFWYGGLYLMASCSRSGKIPPGLWGNWITTDNPDWCGDFHMNYNHEAPFWALYSSNHVDTADCYETPLLDAMPVARKCAREKMQCRGLAYPVGLAPWGVPAYWHFWGQKSNAAFGAINMAMRFYSTWDLDYARKVYPYMKEMAEFWEDDLKFEPATPSSGDTAPDGLRRPEPGRYMIYKDAVQEDLEGGTSDVNPIHTLGLLRSGLKALIDMSLALGVDEDRREKWEHMRTRLAEFPVQQRDGKTVFRYTEKGTDWWNDNALGIQHIWPAGAIGLDSDPRLLEISRNTVTAMGRWSDSNGFPTFYTAAARVGYDPRIILQHLREECGKKGFPNLHIYYYGGGIENCGGIVSAPNEMLMQSHEGVIRVFPAWPNDLDARFGNLRAYGAFLVSSERKDSRISYVKIVSEKGRDCVVENPWPEEKVQVMRSGKAAEALSGSHLTFRTGVWEEIALTCCAPLSDADGRR